MSDLISREEALNVLLNKIRDVTGTSREKSRDGLCVAYYLISKEIPSAEAEQVTDKLKNPCDSLLTEDKDGSKERKSKLEPSGDLISRADAMGAVQDHFNADGFKGYDDGQKMMDRIKALPSAVADGEDLIIKGAKGIQDGLYNIKDGKLFMYKANGGTVRSYPIVPSADRPSGEWIFDTQIPIGNGRTSAGYRCSVCGADYFQKDGMKYCPSCGARMKGGAE